MYKVNCEKCLSMSVINIDLNHLQVLSKESGVHKEDVEQFPKFLLKSFFCGIFLFPFSCLDKYL